MGRARFLTTLCPAGSRHTSNWCSRTPQTRTTSRPRLALVKRPLPFANLKHDGGILDLNHPPYFSCPVHAAPRLSQTSGIVFVGYDEKPASSIPPQFDGQTPQNRFKRSGFLFRSRLGVGESRLGEVIDVAFDVQLGRRHDGISPFAFGNAVTGNLLKAMPVTVTV